MKPTFITVLKKTVLFSICFSFHSVFAQNVGVNATGVQADASAILDVSATNKGLLVPRVSLLNVNDKLTITEPAHSLLVYNINDGMPYGEGYYYNSGTTIAPLWIKLSVTTANPAWLTSGNDDVNDDVSYMGTNIDEDVVFRRNGVMTLQMRTGGALLATGNSMGITPESGQGTRMMYIPAKAAFRVGKLDDLVPAAWDHINIGDASFAANYNTKASGNGAAAFGIQTEASGGGAVSLGAETRAIGGNSLATGFATQAKGGEAVAMGNNTIASNTSAVALGNLTEAGGVNSLAAGFKAKATNTNTVAIGNETEASGQNSFAAGNEAKATGLNAIAAGRQTQASGSNSIAMGDNTVASGARSFVVGILSNATNTNSIAMGGGANATALNAVAIGADVTASGSYSTAMGNKTTSSGVSAFSAGNNATAEGNNSTAMGLSTTAKGNNSTATGNGTSASGESSVTMGTGTATGIDAKNAVALGLNTDANGAQALAVGNGTKANGTNSLAMGGSSEANGVNSFAAGTGAIAEGTTSAAFGNNTKAYGTNSMAIGQNTITALGSANTFAQGESNTAVGKNSAVFGFGTFARARHSMVVGLFNNFSDNPSFDVSASTDRVFQVGGGSGEDNRRNAMTVLRSGRTAVGSHDPQAMFDINKTSDNTDYKILRLRDVNQAAYYDMDIYNGGAQGYYLEFTTNADKGRYIFRNDLHDKDNPNPDENYLMDIGFSGGLFITGTLYENSDMRLKENVNNLSNVLGKINKIQPITYYFKDKKAHPASHQIGFSAQEVQQQFPELVLEDANKSLSVNYTHMSAVLLQAIKEQQQQIEELKKEKQDQKDINNQLLQRMEKLEAAIKK